MSRKNQIIIIGLLLILVPLGIYYQINGHDYISMDDPFFIQQHNVPAGITLKNLKNAFTLTDCLWMPLTWLSHMADSQLYGKNPGGHHFTSLIIHIINSLLLFLLLLKMTGRLWPGALIALLLAVHPVNVEAVAYLSARKGLLCSLFWLLTLHAYAAYTQNRTIIRYGLAVFFFILGAMAKPAIVMLPAILLLLDYWPLQRTAVNSPTYLATEKIPFFLISIVISIVAVTTQHQAGTVLPLETASFLLRIQNTLVSYAMYLWNTIYPLKLAIFYPYPREFALWKLLGAGGLLIAITMAVICGRRQRPWLLTGWLWFLLSLLPAIGLIKTGQQARADRYAYIPLIGIFIIFVWEIYSIKLNTSIKKFSRQITVIGVLMLLTFLSWRQTGYWKNSRTIFQHAIEVTPDNYLAHNNLGEALVREGEKSAAYRNFAKALEIFPGLAQANSNLGMLLMDRNQTEKATAHFRRAIQSDPDFIDAHYHLGNIYLKQDDLTNADHHFQKVLALNPNKAYKAGSHDARGIILARQQKINPAIQQFQQALSMNPDMASTHNSLGQLLVITGDTLGAIYHFQTALALRPGHLEPANHLAKIYKEAENYTKALELYKSLLIERPDCSAALCYNIAAMASRTGDVDAALKWLRESIVSGFKNFGLLSQDDDFENIRNTEAYQKLIFQMAISNR